MCKRFNPQYRPYSSGNPSQVILDYSRTAEAASHAFHSNPNPKTILQENTHSTPVITLSTGGGLDTISRNNFDRDYLTNLAHVRDINSITPHALLIRRQFFIA